MALDEEGEYNLGEQDNNLLAEIADQAQGDTAQGNPVPEDVRPELDTVALQSAEPASPGNGAVLPDASLDAIAAQATPAPPDVATAQPVASSEAVERAQGDINAKAAEANTALAQRQADIAQQHDEDTRLAYADFLEHRKAAQTDLDNKVAEYNKQQFTDPSLNDRKSWRGRLSVIMGALGGSHDGSNVGLEAMQKRWHDNTELQKANIGLMKDKVAMARTGIEDGDQARAVMRREADARLVSQYDAALKDGTLQLKKLGVPQAAIDTDKRILSLRAGQAAAKAKALKDADEHALAQARIAFMQRKAKAAKVTGGGKSHKQELADNKDKRAASREERMDATDAMKGPEQDVKEFSAKGGTRDSIIHAKRGLDLIAKDPNDPANWVHLIDALIKSNTGKSAILSQYQLFMGHTAPANAEEALSQFRAKYSGGLPSPVQRENILRSAKGILGSLQTEAKDFHDNFRSNYDNDDSIKSNPRAWEKYNRLNQATFGVLPGYEKTGKTPAATPAKATPKPVGADIMEMLRFQKQGDTRFDAILEKAGYGKKAAKGKTKQADITL